MIDLSEHTRALGLVHEVLYSTDEIPVTFSQKEHQTEPIAKSTSKKDTFERVDKSSQLFSVLHSKSDVLENQVARLSLESNTVTGSRKQTETQSHPGNISAFGESAETETVSKESSYRYLITCPKILLVKLEEQYRKLGKPAPKRDRMHNNFMKAVRSYLHEDFRVFCPEFEEASNSEKMSNFSFNRSLYEGKWEGLQFIFGSFISRETMKQMISSSREKAYFYGLLKCFKNSSQKKLAIVLKNEHLVCLIDHVFT
jgi:hypothetical protein